MKHSDNPKTWTSMLTTAMGNIFTGIKKMRNLELPDEEILAIVKRELIRGIGVDDLFPK